MSNNGVFSCGISIRPLFSVPSKLVAVSLCNVYACVWAAPPPPPLLGERVNRTRFSALPALLNKKEIFLFYHETLLHIQFQKWTFSYKPSWTYSVKWCTGAYTIRSGGLLTQSRSKPITSILFKYHYNAWIVFRVGWGGGVGNEYWRRISCADDRCERARAGAPTNRNRI